jgi:hypothetical protein
VCGSQWCGLDLGRVSGTVLTISEDGMTLTLSGRTEAERWFENGPLFIGGEWRRILSSNGQTFQIDYPFEEISVGSSYEVERRCNQTYDDCKNRFGNEANYGGYLGIPEDGYTVKRFT